MAAVAACSPGSSRALRLAALLPVAMKCELVSRGLTSVATRMRGAEGLVESNLGISDELRVLVPFHKSHLVFGRPSGYEAERGTLELAAHCCRHSQCFLDVGANEGVFTFFVASAIGRKTEGFFHIFEPDSVLHNRLTENLARNGMPANLNRVAVGERTGKQIFHRNLDDDSSGSLVDYFASKHRTEAVEISVTSLSDYLQSHDLHHACIKVDVEGAGLAVWNGMSAVLDRVDWLIFEILTPEIEANLLSRIVGESNWYAYYIRDYELMRSYDGEFEYRAPYYNWLFCRHDPSALREIVHGTAFSVIEPLRRPAHS